MRWSAAKALRPWGSPWPIARDEEPADASPPRPLANPLAHVLAEVRASGSGAVQIPWSIPDPAPGVMPSAKMAMDWQAPVANLYGGWAQQGVFTEGLAFLGYQYLSELAQRPEYRQIVKKYADHMTRKWIKLTGGTDAKKKRLEKALTKFHVRDVFREIAEHDGFFGRGQIFIDIGQDTLTAPLTLTRAKLFKKLRNLKTIEPVWSYPGRYDSLNPLDPEFYRPREWYVSGQTVHASRMLTIIGREMPDILKPAYAFGGLARTQMAKPYVENWLRTRQSVSDIIHAFTVWVLKTNMADLLKGVQGAAGNVINRLAIFNEFRDNHGSFAIDKDTEEFANVSASLASLDKLQAQAQEQMAAVSAIPLIELLGIAPSGLNATTDGEIRTFYANIKTDQERMLREPLKTVLEVIQLSEFGAIDPTIGFEFEDLWEISETELADVEKKRAEIDQIYVNAGIVSNEESRERISQDEQSPYHGVDLSGPPPDPVEEAAAMAEATNIVPAGSEGGDGKKDD